MASEKAVRRCRPAAPSQESVGHPIVQEWKLDSNGGEKCRHAGVAHVVGVNNGSAVVAAQAGDSVHADG